MKKGKEQYDVFISYRREDGWESAKHLRDILVAKGYSVFFDIDSLKNGNFNDAILDYIKNCKDFIIILSPHSLDRCVNEGDWVRKELACALKEKKNIIPVMYNKFSFPETLPEDIEGIRHINGIPVYMEVFDAIVKKIISFMESKSIIPRIVAVIAAIFAVAALAGYFIWSNPGSKVTEEPLPTASPAPMITEAPTPVPTAEPTAVPTEAPTAVTKQEPTVEPTATSTAEPTQKSNLTSVGFIDGDYRWVAHGILAEYLGSEKNIVLPDQGYKLFSEAFRNSSVESVIVPNSYQEFDFGAFDNCKILKTVVIENEKIQVNSYQELGVFINCPNVVVYCHKDSKTYETLLKTHSGEIRFIEDEDAGSTEKKDTSEVASSYTQTKHNWGDYEPKGTVTITMNDGTVYKGAANSVVLMVKNTKWNVLQGGSENLYDGIGTPDDNGQLNDDSLKPFLEIVRIQNRNSVFSTLDDEGVTEDYTLPDDAQLWFISTDTTYTPKKINVADVDEIAFNRDQTMDFDDLPYCTVYLDNGCFCCPAAFLLLKYNVKTGAPPAMKIAHEFTSFSNYPTKIKAISSLEVTRVGTDDPYRAIQEGIGVRVTMKSGETIDFDMKGYFTFVAMSQYGRIRDIKDSALRAIVFDAAEAGQASATESPTAVSIAGSTASGVAQFGQKSSWDGGNLLMADAISSINTYSICYQAHDFAAFNGTVKRGEVSSVTFLDSLNSAPADAWDVSQISDGSVLAWTSKNGELYDLFIAGKGGVAAPRNCFGLFCGYENMTAIDFGGAFHTDYAVNMGFMFCNCWKLKAIDLRLFDTRNVTQMESMFQNCAALETLDVSSFDTANVIYMGDMFYGASRLTELNLSGFSTGKVWGFDGMFFGCRSLTTINISSFEMGIANYFKNMFKGCSQLITVNLPTFPKKTANTNTEDMFFNCDSLAVIYFDGTKKEWAGAGLADAVPIGVQVLFSKTDESGDYDTAALQALEALENEMDRYSRSVYVYKDDGDSENHFTQRMLIFGNDPSLVRPMDNNWRENPHSGDSCIRCEVETKEGNWGG